MLTKDTTVTEMTNMMVGHAVTLNIVRPEPVNPKPRIEVQGLTVRNEEGIVKLKDVSFTANSGEILGIAGISGCGQKELLESIAGLQVTESGSITYINEDGSSEELNGKEDSFIPTDLRASYDILPLEEYQCAGKASQILTWDKQSRFCPACGTPTEQTGPITKRCPHCGLEIYPRISPAVIVLIKKGDSILLVHARNFRGTFKGLVAGFLEPGETLEECVLREVREETGIRIKNLTYFGSQPWPYPSGIKEGY